MKTKNLILAYAALLAAIAPNLSAQDTSFTYQGQLKQNGSPTTGLNDLSFTLFDSPVGGNLISNPIVANDIGVTNGLFSVLLDFGGGAFNGAPRWLQIDVRPGESNGAFTGLTPRQALTPAPYAIYAGSTPAAGLTGQISGSQIAEGSIRPAQLDVAIGFWDRVGNEIFYSAGNMIVGDAVSPTTLGYPSTWKTSYLNNSADNSAALVEGKSLARVHLRTPSATTGNRNFTFDMADNKLNMRWLTDGLGLRLDALTVDPEGLIGIGTTTPTERLSVNGNAAISGNASIDGNAVINGTLNAASINTTTFLATKIGIGTNTPATAVHVVGSSDTELSLESAANHRRWTLQASGGANGTTLGGTFQIIDRTAIASRLLITTNGNVGIGTGTPATKLDVAGEVTMTACNITSDRNAKELHKAVDTLEVLAKVAQLPITEWQYKTQGDARHIGPMAQDFREAFALGRDEKHITTVDADGVALAAIQGLNQLVQQQRESIAELQERNQKLEKRLMERLSQLEALLSKEPTSARVTGSIHE